MPKQSLSAFRKEVRRLLKKYKRTPLARSVKASKLSSKNKKRAKSKRSVRRYRSKQSKNSVNGGAVRDGSPQRFLKC